MLRADSSTQSDRLRQAFAHTAEVAGHYENFTVVSMLLPRKLRQHFVNVYAFCRHADDLADETGDPIQATQALERLREDVQRMYDGEPQELIQIALQQTVRQFEIPSDPFLKLIDAFLQDQRVGRYDTYYQVLDYCSRSADPVGHLVLYLCGYRDAERQRLADFTCTALQLANFWQDVANDMARGRLYIPGEDMTRFRVREEDLLARRYTPQFAQLLEFEVRRTEELFDKGEALLPMVNRRVRTDVALYGRGGRAVLKAIRDIGYNTLQHRPTIGRWTKLGLLARYLVGL